MAHDFEKQKKETFWVWSDIQTRNPAIPDRVNLDIQFIPIENDINVHVLKLELEKLDYAVSFYDDDDTVEANIKSIENSAEEIWYHEERTSKVALRHGYKPDGWGFMSG